MDTATFTNRTTNETITIPKDLVIDIAQLAVEGYKTQMKNNIKNVAIFWASCAVAGFAIGATTGIVKEYKAEKARKAQTPTEN